MRPPNFELKKYIITWRVGGGKNSSLSNLPGLRKAQSMDDKQLVVPIIKMFAFVSMPSINASNVDTTLQKDCSKFVFLLGAILSISSKNITAADLLLACNN